MLYWEGERTGHCCLPFLQICSCDLNIFWTMPQTPSSQCSQLVSDLASESVNLHTLWSTYFLVSHWSEVNNIHLSEMLVLVLRTSVWSLACSLERAIRQLSLQLLLWKNKTFLRTGIWVICLLSVSRFTASISHVQETELA